MAANDGGMVFDSVPVKVATPVDKLQSQHARAKDDSGMTFDAAPVTQATPVDALTKPAQTQPGGLTFQQKLNGDEDDVMVGIAKGAGQTVSTVGGLIRHGADAISAVSPARIGESTGAIPKGTIDKFSNQVKDMLVPQEGVSSLDTLATPTNTMQRVGSGVEGIAEFFLGDEALKGLSIAGKLGLASKAAKLAEAHPVLGKIIEAGLNAVRSSAVGTGQAALHGADAGTALASGATAGLTGGAIEGATGVGSELAKTLSPDVAKIADETIPIRASQNSKLADAAENVASTKALKKFDINQTQPAARRAVGNIANEIQDATIKSNQIKGATSVSSATSLDSAADNLRGYAKPVFKKLDELTAGRDETFSELQRHERTAYRNGNIDEAKMYKAKQTAILDEFKGQFDPNDFAAARNVWKQAGALDDIHSGLQSSAVIKATPKEYLVKGQPDGGIIDGKALRQRVLNLRGDFANAGFSKKHVQDLQEIGSLLEKSGDAHQLGLWAKVAGASAGGTASTLGLVTHALNPASIPGAVGVLSARSILTKVMTNPEFASKVVTVLRQMGKTAPTGSAVSSQGVRQDSD